MPKKKEVEITDPKGLRLIQMYPDKMEEYLRALSKYGDRLYITNEGNRFIVYRRYYSNWKEVMKINSDLMFEFAHDPALEKSIPKRRRNKEKV